jgi:hypothetical protein
MNQDTKISDLIGSLDLKTLVISGILVGYGGFDFFSHKTQTQTEERRIEENMYNITILHRKIYELERQIEDYERIIRQGDSVPD